MTAVSDYTIAVARRDASGKGYDADPFVATAMRGDVLVAVQFGSQPGIAFQKAWRFVQEDRERKPVTVEVE